MQEESVVRYQGEIKSKVTQQLVELLGFDLRPLSGTALRGLRQSDPLASLRRSQFGHLFDYVDEGLAHRHLALGADALAGR